LNSISLTFHQVTGATNTCWCNSLHVFPIFGDYTNLENANFYRKYCNVTKYWAVATSFGLALPTVAFLIAVFWWLKCQHLWKADEREAILELLDMRIAWFWLT
jgi:hypothetical protein